MLLSAAVVMGVRQRGRRLVVVMRLCQMADIMHEAKLMRVVTRLRPQLPLYPGKGVTMHCTQMKKDVRLSSVAEQNSVGPAMGLPRKVNRARKLPSCDRRGRCDGSSPRRLPLLKRKW